MLQQRLNAGGNLKEDPPEKAPTVYLEDTLGLSDDEDEPSAKAGSGPRVGEKIEVTSLLPATAI